MHKMLLPKLIFELFTVNSIERYCSLEVDAFSHFTANTNPALTVIMSTPTMMIRIDNYYDHRDACLSCDGIEHCAVDLQTIASILDKSS